MMPRSSIERGKVEFGVKGVASMAGLGIRLFGIVCL